MDIIPIQYYSILYFQFLLIVVLLVYIQCFQTDLTDSDNLKSKNAFGFFLLIVITLYMGLRPIKAAFGDMIIYYYELRNYINGAPFDTKKDFLFECMKYFFANFLSPESFFFTCSFLYVFPLYWATKKLFKDYWFYCFLMLVASLSFWAYGVNGIRNGVATSMFFYAISRNKLPLKIFFILVTLMIHKSMLVPVGAYFLASNYTNVKMYFYFWLLTIPLSLALGGFWESFFLNLGFGDEKLDAYLGQFDQASEGVTLTVGFRWDFLLYSASGVFAAWYFIFKKKFNDLFYNKLVGTFLVANGFWILVIRANYSNRFAFLSWFLLGMVIIYPLLKSKFFKNQHVVIGTILIVYFAFTYLLNIIFV